MIEVASTIRNQPNEKFSLVFENDINATIHHRSGPGEDTASDFGTLRPVNVYKEPYLVAHTICNGR